MKTSHSKLSETMKHLSTVFAETRFRHFDMFSGIGGFHIAVQNLGGRTVLANDNCQKVRKVYYRNFPDVYFTSMDIRDIEAQYVPEHDLLTAGFPCQPFSTAGNRKGLEDPEKGSLFYHITRMLRAHKPKVFILENVPNIKFIHKGATWKHIISELERAGYQVQWAKISSEYWVAQRRFRMFIVGVRKPLANNAFTFGYVEPPKPPYPTFGDIVEDSPDYDRYKVPKGTHLLYTMRKKVPGTSRRPGPSIADYDKPLRTFVSRQGGDAIWVERKGFPTRFLTEKECKRIFGFPHDFEAYPARDEMHKQFGNAVVVPLVQSILSPLIKHCL